MSGSSRLHMRILVGCALATGAVLWLVPGEDFAQSMDTCRTQCARDKDSSNASCPIATYDSSQERDACLKSNQETFNSCVGSCPPPEPGTEETSPPANPVMNPTVPTAPTPAAPPPETGTETGPAPGPSPQPAPQQPSGY